MLKVNKNLELALKTLEVLKDQEKPVRTQDIAEKIGVSPQFLEQVLRKLRMAGITSSVRGPGGGNKITKGQTISALSVANALGYVVSPVSEGTGLSSVLTQAIATAFETTRIEL